MLTGKQNTVRKMYAALLQRFIVLLSLPVIASACQVSNQPANNTCMAEPDSQTIVSNDTIKIIQVDTTSAIKVDTIVPVYETPIQVTPCYGVVATPIQIEVPEMRFEAPEYE
ncbi:MAG: hypothetical protein CVU11_08180 [Bacteroidetes bacterium HGW-Bacteroidetes-6]|nr:MAG: hypothetical protein CVU11_08180 [Bacteroidetes bacterium HGW-Bacteroidetes-6]